MGPENEATAGKSGIGGWLLLPALALAVQVYSVFNKLVTEPREWRNRGYTVYYRTLPLVADLILVALVLLTAYLFFRRRRLAPPVYILLVVGFVLAWVVVVGLSPVYGDEPIIGIIFNTLLFPAYFARSKRTAATFVLPLDPANPLDRRLRRLERPLLAFFAFLQRRGLWLLLYAFIFLAAAVVAQSMIRAAFLLHDIGKFGQLLF